MSKYWLVLNTCDSCHHHTLVRTKLGTKEKQGAVSMEFCLSLLDKVICLLGKLCKLTMPSKISLQNLFRQESGLELFGKRCLNFRA